MDRTEALARLEAWDDELARHDRVEIGFRRGRLAALTLGCGVLALAAAAVAVSDGGLDRVMGTVCVVLFGLGSVALGRQALRHGAAVVITSRELVSPTQGWSLPWTAVRGAGVFSVHGTHLVTIAVDPAWFAQEVRDRGAVQEVLARANRRFLGVETVSLPGQLDADPGLLAVWIDSRRTAADSGSGEARPTAG